MQTTKEYYENILRSYQTMIDRATPATANATLNDIKYSIRSVLKSNPTKRCHYPSNCPYDHQDICSYNGHCSYQNNCK